MLKILYELTEDEVEHLNIPNGMPILIEIDAKTLKPVGKQWTYLEPEKARLEAERVKLEGMNHWLSSMFFSYFFYKISIKFPINNKNHRLVKE